MPLQSALPARPRQSPAHPLCPAPTPCRTCRAAAPPFCFSGARQGAICSRARLSVLRAFQSCMSSSRLELQRHRAEAAVADADAGPHFTARALVKWQSRFIGWLLLIRFRRFSPVLLRSTVEVLQTRDPSRCVPMPCRKNGRDAGAELGIGPPPEAGRLRGPRRCLKPPWRGSQRSPRIIGGLRWLQAALMNHFERAARQTRVCNVTRHSDAIEAHIIICSPWR